MSTLTGKEKRLSYMRYFFATDNRPPHNVTIFASRKKADIAALLGAHPDYAQITPVVARQRLELRDGTQFLECRRGLWMFGYVPNVTRRWTATRR